MEADGQEPLCAVCAGHTVAGAHNAQSSSVVSDSSSTTNGTTAGGGGRFAESPLTYQRTSQLKIFLSYGHDRYQLLAFHLKHALQERGHCVWVDVEKLKAGIDWEDGITGALTWVKEAQHDGRVLLIMTPHALRRPDGYCLNEIARAASNRLNIFPVMVSESEPPPAIAMLPYFDLMDCVPTDAEQLSLDPKSDEWIRLMKKHVHSEIFQEKAKKLYTVLELFDTMNAYGVPAVAGVENLGLSSAFDGTRHRESRAMSLRRLLQSQASTESLGGALDSPHSHHKTSGSFDSMSGSGQNLLSLVVEETAAENENENENDDQDEEDSDEAADKEAAAFRGKYMFSFDDSCYLLAKKLYDDLTQLGFQIFEPPAPPRDPLDLEAIQRHAEAHEEALQFASSEKTGKMILLVTPESVGRPSGVCLNDISAAMAAGVGFVPLMVRNCEIPLSICRIQWLDMADCLIYHRGSVGSAATGEAATDSGSTVASAIASGSGSLVASASINELRYATRKDQLITALQGKLDHDGQQARLFSLLSPFSFQLQISQLTQRFTGRKWLFETIRAWIDDTSTSSSSSNKVFWVTGQIGTGKTSVAAKMVQEIPEIAAFHFALQEDEQTQLARRCVLSLAYQLTTQLPEYAVFLQTGEPLEEIVPVSSVQALLSHLLINPLNAIARPKTNKPLVLLIDGLEHLASNHGARRGGAGGPPSLRPSLGGGGGPSSSSSSSSSSEECLVSLLPSLISRLPSWVRVILLSREDHNILLKLQDYTPSVSLDRHEQENEQDIRQFVETALCRAPSTHHNHSHSGPIAVATATGSPSLGPVGRHRSLSRSSSFLSVSVSEPLQHQRCSITSDQVELITKRSEGLFLYAANIVQSIEEGRLSVDQLASLPLGLGGYLRQFFESHFDYDTKYKTTIRPVLEVLCAAYEPITTAMLASIFHWSTYEQQEMTTAFSSLFFISDDDYVRPFHSSVLEWVQDVKTAGLFLADVSLGHQRLATWAASEYESVVARKHNDFVKLNFELEQAGTNRQKMHIYIVRHVVSHLMVAPGEDCMALVGKFASDENFQLARRLLSLRSEGLESFFHGDITRDHSNELLKSNPRAGSFLIRYSARQKSYCASFIHKVDPETNAIKCQHNLIHHYKATGAYSVVPPELATEKTTMFPDLVSFVEEYQRRGILKTAIPRQSALNRAISTTNG